MVVKLGCWSCRAHVADSEGAPSLFKCRRCQRDNLFWSRVIVDCSSCGRGVSIDVLNQKSATCSRCQKVVRPTSFGIHGIDPNTPFTALDEGPLSDHEALQCRKAGWSVSYWEDDELGNEGPYDDIWALHDIAEGVLNRVERSSKNKVLAILPCFFRDYPALLCWSNVVLGQGDTGTAKFMGAGGSARFQAEFERFLHVLKISVVVVATRAVAALLAQHQFYARFMSMLAVADTQETGLPITRVPVVLSGVKRHAVGVIWGRSTGEKWRVNKVNADGTADLVQLTSDGEPSGTFVTRRTEAHLLRTGLTQRLF
ncbi:hypothetical protein LY474_06925 [Myxococcus stipitatus]|uniref:hypothetical protein n=1 Tax=Myxococcus stipitatus TaxID=83455 RepID=UPI001F2AC6BC|nr:hypothetical protein [Myxococcus stipitatus]MCE9667545.1 hypothetical protein [Myxococcus stipitatus]